MNTASAVIVAAGNGLRMGSQTKKRFMKLNGRPMLAWAIDAFERTDEIGEIIVVVSGEDMDFCKREVLGNNCFSKVKCLAPGGRDRQTSVFNGVMASNPSNGIVVIHDGVRPLVEQRIILDGIAAAKKYGASCTAVPVTDTIKASCAAVPVTDTIKMPGATTPVTDTIKMSAQAQGIATEYDCDCIIESTIDRGNLWSAQTPQCFEKGLLLKALKRSEETGARGTDDAYLVEMIGHEVAIVMGSYENIKITTPIDFEIAEIILKRREK